MAKKKEQQTELTNRVRINKDLYFDESSNAKVIDLTKEDTNQEVTIIEDDSSSVLSRLKEKQIENKKRQTSNQDTPNETRNNIERYYDTDITIGLNQNQIDERIKNHLTNEVKDERGKSLIEIILRNIFTWFNMLYFVVAIILIFIDIKNKESFSNLMFVLLVLSNLSIGLYQEIKTKYQVDKLKLLSNPTAIVMRTGKKLEINSKDVVLDDIIIYQTGKQIIADSIVLDGTIEVNESLLTGEADSIVKVKGDSLLSGSFITSGTCVARVDKVGKDTYISKMSSDAKKYNPPKSELLSTLHKVIVTITILIIPVVILYLFSHIDFTLLRNTPNWFNSFWAIINRGGSNSILSALCYIVLAMIPAGLFLLTSIALFVGVRRLAKQNTLVQELYCIEMLARVDTLCLDKTGTITDGTMKVSDCIEIDNKSDYTIREIVGSLLKTFEEQNQTSEAMVKYFGLNDVLTPTIIIPFSSKRKYSAVTFDGVGTYAIGAPDFVLKENYSLVEEKVNKIASNGSRVLALGHTKSKFKGDQLPTNLTCVALIVLQDHIREDASNTIAFFKQNGVNIKVISGDNPETVSKIAQRVGIEQANRFINLNGLSDDEIREKVFDYTVFGRVTPDQKKLIVETLKKSGRTVAMTGDGVNDIPALKEADCSIAMASGSDAVRYVSHLVLLDSNFSSMPSVVMEGRRVINNVQKTSALYLTKNLFAFLLAMMYIIIGFITLFNRNRINLVNTEFPFRSETLMLIEMVILGFATTLLAIQPNRDIVKGHFLPNVLRQIVPGAVTVLVFQIILFSMQFIKVSGVYAFPNLFNGDYPNIYRTISSVIATLIMLFVLYEACIPFNRYRRFVFSSVVIVIIGAIIIAPVREFLKLDFSNFGVPEYLLLIIMVEAVYPMMMLIKKILKKKDYDQIDIDDFRK